MAQLIPIYERPIAAIRQHAKDLAAWGATQRSRPSGLAILDHLHTLELALSVGEPAKVSRSSRQIYMVVVGPTGSVFVKEHDFFRDQGGFNEPWGKDWVPCIAANIEAAREWGCALPGARPYDQQAQP